MHRLCLTFTVFRILFPFVLSVSFISATNPQFSFSSIHDEHPAVGALVDASLAHQSDSQQQQRSPEVSVIDFLRRAVTPSLLSVITYIVVVQYILPWLSAFRNRCSDSAMSSNSDNDESDIPATTDWVKTPPSCLDDFSTQSSSVVNSPVVHSNTQVSVVLSPSTQVHPSVTAEELDQRLDKKGWETNTGRFRNGPEYTIHDVKKRKSKKPGSDESNNQINKVAENILIRDQWLALVDSTDVTLHQLLIQLESGRSAILKGINDFVASGRVVSLLVELRS